MALKRNLRNSVYGFPTPTQELAAKPVISQRAPRTTDHGELGQLWVNVPAQDAYVLVETASNVSTWINIAGGSGYFETVEAAVRVIAPEVLTQGLTLDSDNMIIETTTTGDIGLYSARDIVLDGAQDINLDADNQFTIDAAATSTITVTGAGANLTMSSVGGSLEIAASEASASAIAITASDVDGGINMIAGTGNLTATVTGGNVDLAADALLLNGVHIYTGAGAPDNAKALAIGDMYIRTDAANANERLYIASALNTWVSLTASA